MKEVEYITGHQSEFLAHLKSKFTLIHMSNVFFRDFHYGVMSFLADHGVRLGYTEAEKTALDVGSEFERKGIFKKIDHQSWLLNYPEFALPRVEKKAS